MKILFICSRNRLRSLTAEHLFAGRPGYDVRSAGTQPGARVVVTERMVGWADVIMVMEKRHRDILRQKFPGSLDDKEVIVLGIPDIHEYMAPELVEELQASVSARIELPSSDSTQGERET